MGYLRVAIDYFYAISMHLNKVVTNGNFSDALLDKAWPYALDKIMDAFQRRV